MLGRVTPVPDSSSNFTEKPSSSLADTREAVTVVVPTTMVVLVVLADSDPAIVS